MFVFHPECAVGQAEAVAAWVAWKLAVSGYLPIFKLVLENIDARPGLDRLQACLPVLERAFARWQQNGGSANFPLLVAAASPCDAVIFHFDSWPDADGRCEPDLARQAVLAAIERHAAPGAIGIIAAGLSLLLGPKGRARQQRDAGEIRAAGSVPLIMVLMAQGSGEAVEMMVSTVAVVPRILH